MRRHFCYALRYCGADLQLAAAGGVPIVSRISPCEKPPGRSTAIIIALEQSPRYLADRFHRHEAIGEPGIGVAIFAAYCLCSIDDEINMPLIHRRERYCRRHKARLPSTCEMSLTSRALSSIIVARMRLIRPRRYSHRRHGQLAALRHRRVLASI